MAITMDWNAFSQLFLENIRATSIWEVLAVAFGIISVWYARKANILVYPTGIVSTTIYIIICYNIQLYADMGINLFYTGMSIYGWYVWTRKVGNNPSRPIRWNTRKQQLTGFAMIPILYVIILGLVYYFMRDNADGYMNSYVPYIDAFTTSIFLIAMWFMARKTIESWMYWIVGNIISIPLYFAKGLVFTSFQFTVFLVLAMMGLANWIRIYNKMSPQPDRSVNSTEP